MTRQRVRDQRSGLRENGFLVAKRKQSAYASSFAALASDLDRELDERLKNVGIMLRSRSRSSPKGCSCSSQASTTPSVKRSRVSPPSNCRWVCSYGQSRNCPRTAPELFSVLTLPSLRTSRGGLCPALQYLSWLVLLSSTP